MEYPLDYLASYDPGIMYFNQAMKHPDCKDFLNTAITEVISNCKRKHWKILPRAEVPKVQHILESVLAMEIKKDRIKRQVYKWKARLNIHGGKQEYIVNQLGTYSHVAT